MQNPPDADLPLNRMTRRCKNIALSQTSFAGGNKDKISVVHIHYHFIPQNTYLLVVSLEHVCDNKYTGRGHL